MNVIAEILAGLFPETDPVSFYRAVFPDGELDEVGAMTKGKYMAIAVEILDRGKGHRPTVHRYSMGNDLAVVRNLQSSEGFCLMAPITYAGKTRKSDYAVDMYALVVELDSLIDRDGRQQGLHALISLWGGNDPYLPRPTYLVASGRGVHLYYVFDRPLHIFNNVAQGLSSYKNALTRMVWNIKTTTKYEEQNIEFESPFQGFRMVGTRTKDGDAVRAFRTGGRVSIAYMNSFTQKLPMYKNCVIPEVYKSNLTLSRAKELYPEWYQERIVEKKPRGKWDYSKQKGHNGDEIYNWWIRRIRHEAVVGHRYYCLMMLCIYAIKCDIEEDRLMDDLYSLLPIFEDRTVDDLNHFTEKDLQDALQAYYDKSLYTYPVASIQNRSGIPIQKNKRNGRKQAAHLRYMRMQRAFKISEGENMPLGRPPLRDQVVRYIKYHPDAKKSAVARELGISRTTVDKYWDEGRAEADALTNSAE